MYLVNSLNDLTYSGQIFGLIFSFLSNKLMRVVLDGKSYPGYVISRHEYPVNARVPQASIPVPPLFVLFINDLPDEVISDIAILADDTSF